MSDAQQAEPHDGSRDEGSDELDLRADVDLLEEFVANAQAVVREAKLHFGDGELSMRAVGPGNVAMVQQTVPASEFVEYHTPDVTVGVNLESLADRLGMIDGEARLRYDAERGEITLTGDGLRFDDGAIDPTSIRQEPDIPELDQPATIVIDADRWRRGLKAASLVSDHVTVGAKAGLGVFYVEGDGDTGDARDALEGENMLPGSQIDEDCESFFSIEYAQDMAKSPGVTGEITLQFGDDVPMELQANGLRFVLAPRIANQ